MLPFFPYTLIIFRNSTKSTSLQLIAVSRGGKFVADSLAISFSRFAFALRDIFRQIFMPRRQTVGLGRYLCTTLRFRCLHRRLLLRSPQINGSCAISRIVAVLFSHFRSIRRATTLPSCTSLRAKRFRVLQRGTFHAISGAEWSRQTDAE